MFTVQFPVRSQRLAITKAAAFPAELGPQQRQPWGDAQPRLLHALLQVIA